MTAGIGFVVIGRNEGDRLARCLQSVIPCGCPVVYVDSGSTDGSLPLARSLGVLIEELDMYRPFTAARARNAGLTRLLRVNPEVGFVHFLDGDCCLISGWVDAGHAFLQEHPGCAAVCGRRREQYPDRSVYNRLADVEWDTPVGEADACGGDCLMRVAALQEVGGFDAALVAGEEPELCLRLRQAGWTIHRLDADMAWHDMNMTSFRQWWRRSVRFGYGSMQASRPAHAGTLWKKQRYSAAFWGMLLPVLCIVFFMAQPAAGLLVMAYPLQVVRLTRRSPHPHPLNWLTALFFTISKFSQAWGMLAFIGNQLRGAHHTLIEYKAS